MPVVALLAFGPAPAHEDAIGIIADRMEVMKDMASHMSALGKMLDGRAAYDVAAVRDHARALHEKCLEAAGQFPDDAYDHHSRAAAAVWDQPERFKAQMDNLERAATELVSATAPGRLGSVRPQFADVGHACASCHEAFRLPED